MRDNCKVEDAYFYGVITPNTSLEYAHEGLLNVLINIKLPLPQVKVRAQMKIIKLHIYILIYPP
jgi:hypothetical protein